jgi:hypothetical protein
MMKVLETGNTVCLPCGDGLDGAIIDYETERNESEPDCDVCITKKMIAYCGDCLYPINECEHGRELKNG